MTSRHFSGRRGLFVVLAVGVATSVLTARAPRSAAGQLDRAPARDAALTAPGAATDIKVTPLVAEGRVSASFAAPAAFTDDSREIVQSGVLLVFTYVVELRRPSTILWDRTLGSATVGASVKFNNLTSVYQVTKQQDGRVTWAQSTPQEDEMRGWVTEFDRVPVQVSEALEANADYYLRVRVQAHPRARFSLWPWGRDDGSGRADFTFIR